MSYLLDLDTPVDEAPPVLPAGLRLGVAHLTVTDLDRSAAFYAQAIGLSARGHDDGRVVLGTETSDVLTLSEDVEAAPAGRHAGLYHVALRFPSRLELARVLQRLTAFGASLSGASDHGVSEALYLRDPDGNGLELYADRPRSAWPSPAGPAQRVGMYTIALDVPALLDLAAGDADPGSAPSGLEVGHVHLHVGDVQRAVAFYADVLGFQVMADWPTASFLAAGGYHHHLAVNVWRGVDVEPEPPRVVGLREWEIVLPAEADVDAVRFRAVMAGIRVDERPQGFAVSDPWGQTVVVRA